MSSQSSYDHLFNFGVDVKADYFKITNLAPIPVHKTWNKFLLDPEDLEKYEAYKQTREYIGFDATDTVSKKSIPEAVKVRPFYDQLGKGVRFRVTDKNSMNQQTYAQPRMEYQWCLGANINAIRREKRNALGLARFILQSHDREVDMNADLETLLKAIKREFGHYETVLTADQWKESGLRALEKREKLMQLKPGETKQRIILLGYLDAEPISQEEYLHHREYGFEVEDPISEQITESPVHENSTQTDGHKDEIEELENKVEQTNQALVDFYQQETNRKLRLMLAERGIEAAQKTKKEDLIKMLLDSEE